MIKGPAITAALVVTGLVSGAQAVPEHGRASEATLAALDPTRLGRIACRGLDLSGSTLDQRLRMAAALAERQDLGSGRMGLYPDVGTTDLPLGDLDPLARRYFEQGLALAYGFNHAAAIRSFRQARDLAPDCALCWWGEAMANGPNINAGMDAAHNRAALAALEQARLLAADSSPAVTALIEAQAARYSADPAADRAALDAAYADAMLAIARANPDSDDLAILAAESAMNTTPWDYWESDTKPRPRIGDAIALIEKVMARSPAHPQASHLYIHLMELPQPRRAEAAADRLRDTGPASLGHLVHMPSHIYYRIGRYADSIEVNRKAVSADEAYLAQIGDDGLVRYGYYPHNVHFLLTSAQMMGDVGTIMTQSAKLKTILDIETARELPWVQAIHAAPYFAQVQYSAPHVTLGLTREPHELAYVEAMRRYARAAAHAQAGNEEGFAAELARLENLAADPDIVGLVDAGFPAVTIIELAALVAKGRMALTQGRPAEAIAHLEAATELEQQIPYNEPPYWYYPVSQSLGAAHFIAGDFAAAREAFRRALFEAPNDAMALYGLAQAERALGNELEAEAAEAALEKVWLGQPGWLRMDRI